MPRRARRLFAGGIVNPSEGRPAEHVAERGSGAPDAVDLATARRQRMRALVDAIEGGAFGDVTGILHIGIGGSALGPALLVDALGRDGAPATRSAFCRTSTARRSTRRSRDLDPATTLVVVASKTFTTTETLTNWRRRCDWLREAGVDDPYGRVIAVTAKPEAAVDGGIDETRVLPFARGRRRALFAVALGRLSGRAGARLGRFRGIARRRGGDGPPFPLCRAGAPMCRCSPPSPTCFTRASCGCQTRAVFAYDERLRLLPPYLQQLEMEFERQVGHGRRAAARPGRARRSPGAGSAPTPSTRCSSCSTRARIWCRSSSSPSSKARTARPRASPAAAAQLLRARRGADGRAARATIRSAAIPATGPSATILLDGSTRARSAR